MSSHLIRLRREMVGRRATNQVAAIAIGVPADYIALCRTEYLGLPLVPAAVLEPTLQIPNTSVTPSMPSHPPASLNDHLDFRRVDVTFVVGSHFFHADRYCALRRIVPVTGREHRVIAVDCESAHRSRLVPCGDCSVELSRNLDLVFGPVPADAKKRLPLPPLRPSTDLNELDPTDLDVGKGMVYGISDDPDDPRFQHRSALEWGTLSYTSDPNEYYGEPTDDDHDWRGNDG